MKDLTKTKEHKTLSKLPHRINQLKRKLKDSRQAFTIALNDKEDAVNALEKAYKTGTNDDIAEAKKLNRELSKRIEKLKDDIDTANSDLDSANSEFDSLSASFREMAVKQVNEVLPELESHVKKVDELNQHLKEINQATSFGSIGSKVKTVPIVPSLDIPTQTEKLKKKIQSWHSITKQ